jgi:hypothetical protein
MSSTDFLVVNPALTTVAYAQRITAATLLTLIKEEIGPFPANHCFSVIPYSQAAQRKLKGTPA